jgi:hypothetical protein
VTAAVDIPQAPELLEVAPELAGQLRGACGHHEVLLPRPGIGGPVGRAGPDGLAVAHGVLVMHEVGNSRNADGWEGERLQQVRLCARRWGEDALVVIGVVGDPDRHPPRGGRAQRAGDDVARFVGQSNVVERQVERAPCLAEEAGHPPCHVDGRLPSRLECLDLDHGGATLANEVVARDAGGGRGVG